MKITTVLIPALALSACVTTSTVSSSPDRIGVRGVNASEATPIADAHCDQYSKAASFTGDAPEGRSAYSTYFFDCI